MMGPLIGLALGGIAGGTAAALGLGKNTNRATSFGASSQYKPVGFNQFLGEDWEKQGAAGQNRQGVAIDTGLGNMSRDAQLDALGMMRDQAQGNRPSVAEMQMQRGLDQAIRSQQSMAASARGPAAMAMAQYGAGQNTAQLGQEVNAQAGQLRAQEMANALGMYGQMGTSMRGMDEQRALAQAQLEAQQRQMNDAYQMGMLGQANQVRLGAMNAGVQQQQMLANSWNAAQGLDAQTNQNNANNEWKQYGAVIGGMQGGMQMGSGMGGMGGGAGAAAAGAGGAGAAAGGGGGGATGGYTNMSTMGGFQDGTGGRYF
jgi:hypothetical protein